MAQLPRKALIVKNTFKMTDCENSCSGKELSQTQSSEIYSEQALISGPGNASFFDVNRKNLREFPANLYEDCLYVKHLYLEGNLLEELSDRFFPSLPSLQWLDVRNNILRSLPKSVANHPSLEVLLLQGNQIQALPLELGLVPKLRGIQLLGNPITFPPQEVLDRGVQKVIEFLREEHNIQAPSPSTIRPIAEPFYKGSEFRDDLLSQKFKSRSGLVGQRRKSFVSHKKRAASSNLPVITVKSYPKLGLEPGPSRPKTSVTMSQYKLSDTPPPEEVMLDDSKDLPSLSNRIQSVGRKIIQLWPRDFTVNAGSGRSEAKIHENLLKEMFTAKIKEMLAKQAAIIQRTKDKEMLKKWRQNGANLNRKHGSVELPYDTDPNYMTILSRMELQNPTARQQQKKGAQTKDLKNVGEDISEIFKSLQKLENSQKNAGLSPRTEQNILNEEIRTLIQLQKKLQVLHIQNARQDITIPSLPVRGQRIHVEDRRDSPLV